MNFKSLLFMALLAVLLSIVSRSAQAGDIAVWVNEKGVTSFGNPQFAPLQQHAQRIEVGAVNGMLVPDLSVLTSRPRRKAYIKIGIAPKKNKRGWRGYRSHRTFSAPGYKP